VIKKIVLKHILQFVAILVTLVRSLIQSICWHSVLWQLKILPPTPQWHHHHYFCFFFIQPTFPDLLQVGQRMIKKLWGFLQQIITGTISFLSPNQQHQSNQRICTVLLLFNNFKIVIYYNNFLRENTCQCLNVECK